TDEKDALERGRRFAHEDPGCGLPLAALHAAKPQAARIPSIDIGVGAEIFEYFLTAFLVDHQVNAVAAVTPFQALLRLDEILVIALPVAPSAAPSDLLEVLLRVLAEALEQFIFQRQEELTAARIALAAAAAEQLAVDA